MPDLSTIQPAPVTLGRVEALVRLVTNLPDPEVPPVDAAEPEPVAGPVRVEDQAPDTAAPQMPQLPSMEQARQHYAETGAFTQAGAILFGITPEEAEGLTAEQVLLDALPFFAISSASLTNALLHFAADWR